MIGGGIGNYLGIMIACPIKRYGNISSIIVRINNLKTSKKKNVFNQLNKEVSSEEGEILFSVTQASYFVSRMKHETTASLWHQLTYDIKVLIKC